MHIVVCEAKSRREDIIEEQIPGHVKSVFALKSVTQDTVIPVCVKTVAKSVIRVLEFEAIAREDASTVVQLAIASDALYELVPPVPGI